MKTFKLELNSFQIAEEIRLDLTGQEMIIMGWEIGDDSPDDDYALIIEEGEITCAIYAGNTHNETVSTNWTFDYIDTIQDLIRHGYLHIANKDGDTAENGFLEIMD